MIGYYCKSCFDLDAEDLYNNDDSVDTFVFMAYTVVV